MTKLDPSMNTEFKASEVERRAALEKVTTAPKERFSAIAERMIYFLGVGYKVKEYNVYGQDGYTTVLEYNGKEQPFFHDHPLEPIFKSQDNKEQILLTYLKQLGQEEAPEEKN